LFRSEKKIKRGFSPIYLAILSGILLLILIINGFLEINRTKNGFYLFLEREASVLFQQLEKNIQETLSSLELLESTKGKPFLNPSLSGFLFGLEESIAEYFVEAAHRVDQTDGEKPLTPSDLRSLTEQYLLTSIEFYDPKGNLLKSWSSLSSPIEKDLLLRELISKKRSVAIDFFNKPFTQDHWFSVAIRRNASPGIIALHLDGEQMKRLFRQFSIQRAISDIGLGEGALFISVQDDYFNIIGHTDPSLIGKREEDPFLKSSLQSNRPLSRLYHSAGGEEAFEVAKSFSFKGKTLGLIRIGYSPKEIHPILRQIMKNVALSIFFFLILGGSAITLIWVNQNRHLRRMKEMEDRI